ncbi:MAG TPA: hypothetical protein ACQGQG_10670 [Xylella sp.]
MQDEHTQRVEEKKRQGNRTRDYIQRINSENAELRRRLDAIERQNASPRPVHTPQHRHEGMPALADYGYDVDAWQNASADYLRQQVRGEYQQAVKQQQQQDAQARYDQHVAAFADQHPDFFESVGSIDPSFLTAELQAAIIGHEQGPQIAYHLANHEEALWSLASIRPDLLPAAVSRLAARLTTAPHPPKASLVTPQSPGKPMSNAPSPPPLVSGRSPTETPPEKLTDDDWYRRDIEKRRKR